jgi:hypothetical protein
MGYPVKIIPHKNFFVEHLIFGDDGKSRASVKAGNPLG